MSRYAKAVAWAKRNQSYLVLAGGGTVVLGLVVLGIRADMVFRERALVELRGHIDQLNALGAVEAL